MEISYRNRIILETLTNDVRLIAKKHLEACAGEGIELVVVQARRTIEEQAALYAKGRTVPGRKVTNARPGFSWHDFGMAYDVAVVERGQIIWESPRYNRAGELGKALGLVWGGDFKGVRGDLGHFEYHPGLTLAKARAEAGMA